MTLHDAIVDYVLQLLRVPTPVTDQGPIGEDIEFEQLGEAELEGVRVELIGSTGEDVATDTGPVDWTSRLAITCASRGEARTASGGRASRALHAKVHARLMADASLGGRVFYLGPPELAFDGGARDTRFGVTGAVYELRHRSASRSLEAAA